MGFDVEGYEGSVLEAAHETSNGTRTKLHHGVCGQVPDELMILLALLTGKINCPEEIICNEYMYSTCRL